jgi:hypothetical protein
MPETISTLTPSAPTSTTPPIAAAVAPAPAPEPKPSKSPFASVDAKARVVKQPDKPDLKDAKEPTDKPLEKQPDKPIEKAPEKPTDKIDIDELVLPPEDKNKVETASMKHMRKVVNYNLSKRKELEAEITKLREGANGNGDAKVLSEQLTAKDKRIQELEAEVGTYRYEKNPEFVEKHEKPFNTAAEYAKSLIEGLMVDDNGTQRKATWDNDFALIFSLPPAKAEEQAELMFGARAGGVMRQYEKLHELKRQRDSALQDYHKNAGERTKQAEAERIQKEHTEQKQREEQLERSTKAFAAITKDLQDESPELYSPDPKDADSKAIFDESMALVDKAYFGRDKLKPEERIALDAAIRLRAAAHPMLVRQIDTLKAELEELKASVEDANGSTPGKIRTKKAPTEKKEKGFFEDLRESVVA